MRLAINLLKNFGLKISEEIILMNDYLRMENIVLHNLLEKHKISSREISDAMKLELAERSRKLKPISRNKVVKIAPPKTVAYKWFSQLKNKLYDSSDKQPEKKKLGRPPITKELREEIIQLAKDNPAYSVREIANKLSNTNSKVSYETVRKLLEKEGILPSPDRIKGMSWFDFMKTSGVWQMDFTTTHLTVKNKETNQYEIVCYHILLLIHVATRQVIHGGVCENPTGEWVKNSIRSLLGFELEDSKIKFKVLPRKSPNLNAYIERFHLSLKTECLQWFFLTSETQLRYVLTEYLLYYNHERPHQSLNSLPPVPDLRIIEAREGKRTGKLTTQERLNGLLKFHYREAA